MKLKNKAEMLVKEEYGVKIGFSKGANYEITIYTDTKVSTAQLDNEEMLKLAFWIKKKEAQNNLASLIFNEDHLFDFINESVKKGRENNKLYNLVNDNADRMETLKSIIKEQNKFIENIAIKFESIANAYLKGSPLTVDFFDNLFAVSRKAAFLSDKYNRELD